MTLAASGIQKTRSICPYCGVGCSVDLLSKDDRLIGIQPAMDGPANEGALCVKGQFAYDFVQHPDRLRTPLATRYRRAASPSRLGRGPRQGRPGLSASGGPIRPPQHLRHRLRAHA